MKYVSLLRGINVAGKKKIKMVDLKALFQRLGFDAVQTYIQSGNVIFEADSGLNHHSLIEQAINEQYGFDVPVLVRTKTQWDALITSCPFHPVDVANEGTQVLLTLLSETPSVEAVASLMPFKHKSESLVVQDDVAYIKCPNGYGKTKLSNTFLEKKLGLRATTRNWKTMLKLQEMLGA